MDIKDLDVQPITAFEVKGAFLVTLFPSIFQGFISVLTGKAKYNNGIHIVHDCTLCQAYGHKNCPYIKGAMKAFMIYHKQRFASYTITQKKIVPNPKWTQIPVPSIKVDKKKESEAYEYTS